MESVVNLMRPHLAHAETHGLQACYDLCISWAQAIDNDMPLESYQRDKDEIRHAQEEAQRRANAIVQEAEKRAAATVEKCDLECRRMRNSLQKVLTAAQKSFDDPTTIP